MYLTADFHNNTSSVYELAWNTSSFCVQFLFFAVKTAQNGR